jgi:hypothetical protein
MTVDKHEERVGMKVIVNNQWHIECISCEAQYYVVEYPNMDYSGCRHCGKNVLYVTDHRVKVEPVKGSYGGGERNETVGPESTLRP